MVLKKPLIFLNFELKAETLEDAVKPLNSGHLRVLKNLSVIKRCPLFGGSLRKINTFANKHFFCYSVHVRYFGCPLLGGFTAYILLH